MMAAEWLHFVFSPRKRNTGNALIVRCDRLGDFVIELPYLISRAKGLREKNFRVTLLLAPGMAGLAKHFLDFDGVIELDMKRFIADRDYRRDKIAEIRAGKFELLFNSRIAREFLVDDAVALAAGAEKSYALYSPDRGVNRKLLFFSNRFYSDIFRLPPEVVSEDGIDEFFHRNSFPGAPEACWIAQPAEKKKNQVLVFPGAGDPFRQWGNEKFARLSGKIAAKQPELKFLICGSRSEDELCRDLTQRCLEAGAAAENFAGKTGMEELIRLIRQSRLVIGNDSGCVHLAAYLGTPAVAAAGGGHYGRFVPYSDNRRFPGVLPPLYAICKLDCFNCNWVCRHEPAYFCVRGVTVEEMFLLVEDQITVFDKVTDSGEERYRHNTAEETHP